MNPIDGDLSVTEKKDDGSYSFSISESGSQRQVGPKPKDIGNVNRESYSDSILDNTAVNWVADENGIQVPSDHLPDSPPTDGGVRKMLADLKK
ncbi:endocuticle structural glycoprotein SgAbd-3-like [Daphnia pulicaria]|uniref:endocuticle structural glycoprotein SgAbd-3-like n=1 Tax=Daphnia pulicaria TaxID=35523 RepID=UPI001EEC8E09|nr:endocuticle structural glycoprotein SgAbd-3-like [Daphnia pulicaria]